MARRRASMREGPLAELFRATEAAQHQAGRAASQAAAEAPPQSRRGADEPDERTVEHVPSWEEPRAEIRAARRRPTRRPPPLPIRAADAEPGARAAADARAAPPAAPRCAPSRCPSSRRDCTARRARDTRAYLAVIKVVGVGGAGLNAVNRMIDAGITRSSSSPSTPTSRRCT